MISEGQKIQIMLECLKLVEGADVGPETRIYRAYRLYYEVTGELWPERNFSKVLDASERRPSS